MSQQITSHRFVFEAVEALVNVHTAVREGGQPQQVRMQMADALANLQGDLEEDLRLALSAAADEFAQLPGSACNWIPQSKLLQLEFCGTDIAGELFFGRLEALLEAGGDPRVQQVLEVYAICLSLGFQGKYAGHALEGIEELKSQVLQSIERFPLGVEPPERVEERARLPKIPIGLIVGFSLIFSISLWSTLYLLVAHETETAVGEIKAISDHSEDRG